MRRRPAQRGAEPDDLVAIQRGGLRRRQIVGDDDGFVGQVDAVGPVAAQDPLDTRGHVAQVGGALLEALAGHPLVACRLGLEDVGHRGLGVQSLLDDGVVQRRLQIGVVQHQRVGLEDARLLLAQLARHASGQFQQLAAGLADG